MRTAGLLLLAVVASCWREGPGPAPPPLRPEAAAGAAPAAPKPRSRWRQSAAVAPKPPDPTRTPVEIGRQLAADLRANGDQLLPTYVAGPLVVLDLDAGTLTVECDSAAATLAANWGLDLSDPKRTPPYCRGGQSYTCTQFAMQQILMLELAEPDNWRLVSAVVGNYRNGRSTMASKISQMRAMISTAACP